MESLLTEEEEMEISEFTVGIKYFLREGDKPSALILVDDLKKYIKGMKFQKEKK